MKPFVVLMTYYPSEPLKAWKVGRDLTRITAELGYKPFPGVAGKVNKGAAWNFEELHAEARLTGKGDAEGASWHQDGDNTMGANMRHCLILWADRLPTQFRWNGHVYQPEPFQLVIADNWRCEHRRPPEANGFRMSFRQRVVPR